ncbi:hypothetical protein [Paenibacillus caui]|uniref:hypothetical protein n=1 Tax=Paenibacillus caui TaxID=2873927 RepID=UPI001CA8689E|nr:hypothetical protein [Paenibacillus caui]
MNAQTKMLNRRNNEMDKQLNEENSKAMTDIVCYLRVANMWDYHQEVIRQDLLEMVLSAQERGDNIQTVIGKDYKAFCDEVIESLPKKSNKERVLDLIDTILMGTTILGTINLIFSKDTIALIHNVIAGQPLKFEISISIDHLLSYVIILAAALLIVHVIGRTSLNPEKKHTQSKPIKFIIGGFIGGSVMAILLLIAWIGRQTLFTVNIFAACIFIFVLYIAHKLLQTTMRRQDY